MAYRIQAHEVTGISHLSIVFLGVVVSEVLSSKLLGVKIFTFRDHLRNVFLWGSRLQGFFHKASKVHDSKLQMTVYNGFVCPTLEYALLIWIGATTSMLSRLYSLVRCVLHTIGSGCDLQSLEVRCTISALCYRYKLHYYPFPAIVQALLSAVKAPLLADLLTRCCCSRWSGPISVRWELLVFYMNWKCCR